MCVDITIPLLADEDLSTPDRGHCMRAGWPELFANQRIRLAAAGCCHLAVVAEDGAVYICGTGLDGRL